MQLLVQRVAVGFIWLNVVANPVMAQVESIGGSIEFRSADRPISAPPLRLTESASPDLGKSLPTGPPATNDVLKQLDKDLGQTSTQSTVGADHGSLGARARASEPSGLGRSIVK
jgi:hypothetical protein